MMMQGKCEGPRWLEQDSKHKLKRLRRAHLGGHDMVRKMDPGKHDMVRKVDPNGEASVRCRKCSGCPRCRLGQKLMNRCWPEEKATQEYGNLKIILELDEG